MRLREGGAHHDAQGGARLRRLERAWLRAARVLEQVRLGSGLGLGLGLGLG